MFSEHGSPHSLFSFFYAYRGDLFRFLADIVNIDIHIPILVSHCSVFIWIQVAFLCNPSSFLHVLLAVFRAICLAIYPMQRTEQPKFETRWLELGTGRGNNDSTLFPSPCILLISSHSASLFEGLLLFGSITDSALFMVYITYLINGSISPTHNTTGQDNKTHCHFLDTSLFISD